jgi:hypothetical protein
LATRERLNTPPIDQRAPSITMCRPSLRSR